MNERFADGLWYLAAHGGALKRGALKREILFGDPVVLGRTKDGRAFALRDVCPHRGAPLSAGALVDEGGAAAIQCPYHGWAFRVSDGGCARVPALPSDDARNISGIRARAYETAERNGLLWIYHGDGAPVLPPPDIGLPLEAAPKTATIVECNASFDEAVIGLVDPAHTPSVHRQWWWRAGAERRDKVKTYEPTALGFRMIAHPPSSNSLIYRAFGGAPTTDIEFRLPSLRLEHLKNARRHLLGLTAITPIGPDRVRISHFIYWNSAIFDLFRPALQTMADSFLQQDGDILGLQHANLSAFPHRPLFLGGADEPAKWYLKLKAAWNAREKTGGFTNPLSAAELRWRT